MEAAELQDIEKRLWAAADQLWANTGLKPSEFSTPVLGLIFLRYAEKRFAEAEAKFYRSGLARDELEKSDFQAEGVLYLPEKARFSYLLNLKGSENLGKALNEAMALIEQENEDLRGVLPRAYTRLENSILIELLRLLGPVDIEGDAFGQVYEYFLGAFAMKEGQKGGVFYTPTSIVKLIVEIIQPFHGRIFDPACGSGGMFVQSSHFIERHGHDTSHAVTFFGQEKTATTIRLAKMNLAVHGLEGDIREANTFYEDVHDLFGKCDFVMANPPFNVDLVDAERIKTDPRLPFGLPGVNKQKKVGNGNYLWISYFWSYLNEKGRAGFVMSSQASSAGHGEKDVRRKIVETGDVDVMISIRSNFFYTRTVPCELWHFDRAKPAERRDKVLMLDARNVYRKVTRKIYDFSPEQMKNLSAIVWLYRGQQARFLTLMRDYLRQVCIESAAIPPALAAFEGTFSDLCQRFQPLAKVVAKHADLDADKKKALADAAAELNEAGKPYETDHAKLLAALDGFGKCYGKALPAANDKQHDARQAFDPIAEAIRGLIKQVDLLYKLTARVADLGGELVGDDAVAAVYDRRAAGKLVKQLDEQRKAVVEQLKHAVYFHRQVAWLQDRFPTAELQAVPGLVKLVDRKEIEAADWSLTPGRYVGVAPTEEDEDFDFEQTLRDIHTELADLNKEAVELAAKIQKNFEELGI
jgi:type I restriction enzyme M protein